MANPLVPQGTLNRLRGSIVFADHPELNVTAPFLGEEGLNLSFEGDITDMLPTMTGVVSSPAPYQIASVEIELLKTAALADAYKQQLEVDSTIGDFILRPDASTLSPYPIVNASIIKAEPGRLNGKTVGFMLTLRGAYLVNSSLYDAS